MADDLITSTQPGDVGNLLGDDIGGLDHYSSSHFQTEPLQPQPSAPQPMSATTNASKPLVDDFGFDSSHISTTTPSGGNSANPTGNSAAPNSSSSFTPGPWLKNIDPKVLDLIYWRDVKKTGVVFGSMLFILLSLAIFSVLSVVAYLSLAILSVTLSFRVYKNIMQAVQKSGDGHPFKEYLEWELEMNDQKTQKVVKLVMKHFNTTVRELRRLFLVEDLVDSIKFGLLLWVLTYIGSWFNGMTLIINCVIIVFTLPKIYETNKVQIDNYLAMARSQFNKILQQVQSKLPFLKKKAKAQ